MIDSIVKESKGAYTHDEVFELEVEFVYALQLMYLEKEMYLQRFSHFDRLLNRE